MTFDWPYFVLRADGTLIYSDTKIPVADTQTRKDGSTPVFASVADAEAWLVAHDIRGSVR